MTDLEKQLTLACWKAWKELNAIRARDGVAYHHDDGMPYVAEDYFSQVVEDCCTAVEAATGKPINPWPPELSN